VVFAERVASMTGNKNGLAVNLINCALLASCMLAPAAAQGIRADYNVDCKLFRKKSDGTWFLGAQTRVQVGPTRITLAPGEIARGDFRVGMTDLHSVLLDACGGTRAEPPQGLQSEREAVK